MDYITEIKDYYARLEQTIEALDKEAINQVMNLLQEAYQAEARIFVCGNGGSASTASHIMNDFNKGLSYNQDKKWHIVCLNDNVATIMAIANDDSYDKVFSKQLEGNITKDDILLAISGSGNSKNIIEAAKEAKKVGAKIVGMTGYDGGKLYQMSDYNMHAAINDMQVTEDVHLTFNHMMMSIFYKLTEAKDE